MSLTHVGLVLAMLALVSCGPRAASSGTSLQSLPRPAPRDTPPPEETPPLDVFALEHAPAREARVLQDVPGLSPESIGLQLDAGQVLVRVPRSGGWVAQDADTLSVGAAIYDDGHLKRWTGAAWEVRGPATFADLQLADLAVGAAYDFVPPDLDSWVRTTAEGAPLARISELDTGAALAYHGRILTLSILDDKTQLHLTGGWLRRDDEALTVAEGPLLAIELAEPDDGPHHLLVAPPEQPLAVQGGEVYTAATLPSGASLEHAQYGLITVVQTRPYTPASEVFRVDLPVDFSPSELRILREARELYGSDAMGLIRAAHAAESVVITQVGTRLVQYEHGLPASGMTMFGIDGFLIGREAFLAPDELGLTVLHELQRLNTSVSAVGVDSSLAAEETRAAASFAERAIGALLP